MAESRSCRENTLTDTERIERIQWAIEARARSQHLMLMLYERSSREPAWNETEKSIYSTLVGAAFSLWRAAFLVTNEARTHEQAIQNATTLLKRVLESNTIVFGTEQELYGWTGGYYLNNAKLRLVEAWLRAGEIADPAECRIRSQGVHDCQLLWTDPRQTWERFCGEAEDLTRLLG